MSNNLNRSRALLIGTLAVLITIGAFLVGTTQQSQAVAAQPYGGCDEAWQAPRSDGADDCRSEGWKVRRRVVLDPHAVIRYYNFPTCTVEDASSGPLPCGWIGSEAGNGIGASFFTYGPVDDQRVTYFWSPSPMMNDDRWTWVTRSMGDRLAQDSSSKRRWTQCATREGMRGQIVRCPDGHRQVR